MASSAKKQRKDENDKKRKTRAGVGEQDTKKMEEKWANISDSAFVPSYQFQVPVLSDGNAKLFKELEVSKKGVLLGTCMLLKEYTHSEIDMNHCISGNGFDLLDWQNGNIGMETGRFMNAPFATANLNKRLTMIGSLTKEKQNNNREECLYMRPQDSVIDRVEVVPKNKIIPTLLIGGGVVRSVEATADPTTYKVTFLQNAQDLPKCTARKFIKTQINAFAAEGQCTVEIPTDLCEEAYNFRSTMDWLGTGAPQRSMCAGTKVEVNRQGNYHPSMLKGLFSACGWDLSEASSTSTVRGYCHRINYLTSIQRNAINPGESRLRRDNPHFDMIGSIGPASKGLAQVKECATIMKPATITEVCLNLATTGKNKGNDEMRESTGNAIQFALAKRSSTLPDKYSKKIIQAVKNLDWIGLTPEDVDKIKAVITQLKTEGDCYTWCYIDHPLVFVILGAGNVREWNKVTKSWNRDMAKRCCNVINAAIKDCGMYGYAMCDSENPRNLKQISHEWVSYSMQTVGCPVEMSLEMYGEDNYDERLRTPLFNRGFSFRSYSYEGCTTSEYPEKIIVTAPGGHLKQYIVNYPDLTDTSSNNEDPGEVMNASNLMDPAVLPKGVKYFRCTGAVVKQTGNSEILDEMMETFNTEECDIELDEMIMRGEIKMKRMSNGQVYSWQPNSVIARHSTAAGRSVNITMGNGSVEEMRNIISQQIATGLNIKQDVWKQLQITKEGVSQAKKALKAICKQRVDEIERQILQGAAFYRDNGLGYSDYYQSCCNNASNSRKRKSTASRAGGITDRAAWLETLRLIVGVRIRDEPVDAFGCLQTHCVRAAIVERYMIMYNQVGLNVILESILDPAAALNVPAGDSADILNRFLLMFGLDGVKGDFGPPPADLGVELFVTIRNLCSGVSVDKVSLKPADGSRKHDEQMDTDGF